MRDHCTVGKFRGWSGQNSRKLFQGSFVQIMTHSALWIKGLVVIVTTVRLHESGAGGEPPDATISSFQLYHAAPHRPKGTYKYYVIRGGVGGGWGKYYIWLCALCRRGVGVGKKIIDNHYIEEGQGDQDLPAFEDSFPFFWTEKISLWNKFWT